MKVIGEGRKKHCASSVAEKMELIVTMTYSSSCWSPQNNPVLPSFVLMDKINHSTMNQQ